MIVRPDYLLAINPFIDKPLIKILAGVRRSGKSTILEMVQNELLSRGIKAEQLITRRYTDIAWADKTATDMYNDLVSAMGGGFRYYLFLDELQEIDNWERVVNSITESFDVDVYVTGSNSKLMSAEISTYLTGRYVTISVYTLSFAEYLQFKGNPIDKYKAFADYLRQGGFPVVANGNFDDKAAYQIVDGIYSSVVTRDIAVRHTIRNAELFDRVVSYIVENVGKSFSANAIVNFLKSERRELSVEAVYNYIKWLKEAFIIYPCRRFDLQGKAVLKTQEKYYLSDVSLKYAQMGFDGKMIATMLENIVYLELKRRGYDVYVGKLGDKEVDFVATLRGTRVYVQVCRSLPVDSNREIGNLARIRDNFHKYVITLDQLDIGNYDGVEVVHIADFLLRKEL